MLNNMLFYLVFYSFLGWCLESIYKTILEKKFINSGFLYGPFCPIYGFGAVIMLLLFQKLPNNVFIIFIVSTLLLTVWEYIVGVLLEKIFKTKYWDYSDHKCNIKGRICLTNSFFWGILGVIFINFVHSFIQEQISNIDIVILKYVIYTIAVLMLIDAIICIVKTKNIKSTLEKVEKLNQEIKEKLKEIKESKKNPEKEKITENVTQIVDELKIKRNRIIRRLYRYVYRLKRAFPAINTKEIAEILNKKIDLKKPIGKKRKKS